MKNNDHVRNLFHEVAQHLRELAQIHAQLSHNHQTIALEFARRIDELAEGPLDENKPLELVPGITPDGERS